MKILEKLFGKKVEVQEKALTLLDVDGVTTSGNILGNLADNISESRLLQDYKTSLYLFRGVELIVEVATSQKTELFEILNLDGDAEKVMEHEFLELWNNPSNLQSKKQFERIMYINMIFSGETFIRLIKDDAGNIISMYNVRPDIVEVEIKSNQDGEDYISYTVHLPNGERKEYTQDEMLHIYKPDPQNQLRGAGVLRALYTRVNAEKKATELQNKTFERGGRSEGVLYAAGLSGNQDMAEQISNKVNKSFTSGKPITVLGADSKYQQLSLSPRELEFIESMKFMRDEILLGLGIPKELLTMEDGGALTNGGDRGMHLFLKFTIKPMIDLRNETFNEKILHKYYDENMILEANNVVPEDRASLLKEMTELIKAGVVTVNEAREKLGFDSMEGFDDIKEPQNAPFRIENAFVNRNYLVKKLASKKRIADIHDKMIDVQMRKQYKEFLTLPNSKFKQVYYKAMNSITDRNVEQMRKETRKYFLEQQERMMKKIDESDDPITADLFDIQAEAVITKRLAMQVFPDIAVRSGNAGLEPVKSFYGKVNDFTIDQELIRLIEARALLFATQITGVTYDELSKLIFNGLEEGLSRDDMARQVRTMFSDMSKGRAKRIAQTEGIHMSNLGLNHAYNVEPAIVGKQWISAKDGRVRDEHVRNDGVVVDKGSIFPSGERIPAENSPNCRCVIAPVVK